MNLRDRVAALRRPDLWGLGIRTVERLPMAVQRPLRRAIAVVRMRLGRFAPVGARPIELPGAGPVVLVDARGAGDDAAVAAMLARADVDGPVRIVLLVDDPRVHLYRAAPVAAVEYIPSLGAAFDERALAERLAVVHRTYGVDRVIGAAAGREP